MAETKKRAPARKASAAAPSKKAAASSVNRGGGLAATSPSLTLAVLRENEGARPKRQRIGRGHGSGMVKTGGEGGKGQTVRSGGGKGPAFEGGQTPWARRLPQAKGISQKARDTGHFGVEYSVINIADLVGWDPAIEVNPETLRKHNLVKKQRDGIKVLGGRTEGETLPSGLTFSDVVFSASAREALAAAGAKLPEE
jgi:large subunit ribosomal protein L15